jgi:hypothetical protein
MNEEPKVTALIIPNPNNNTINVAARTEHEARQHLEQWLHDQHYYGAYTLTATNSNHPDLHAWIAAPPP